MGCHDHTAEHTLGSHRNLWAIVEAAHHQAFWALLELIWGQVQTRLHKRMIQYGVVFATGHKREPSQVGEHSTGAILPIEPDQGALLLHLVCSKVTTDSRQSLAEFFSVEPVADGAPNEPSH